MIVFLTLRRVKRFFFFVRSQQVHQHLDDYFRRASGLVEQRDHMIEVCVMCVQCMEVEQMS